MRALVSNGISAQAVELPDWVELRVEGEIRAVCARCRGSEELGQLARRDAELALGRFARWHRRCFDRAVLTIARAPLQRGLPFEGVTYVRRKT